MGKFRNIAGQKFGLLRPLRIDGKDKTGKTTWLCQCDCGKQSIHTMLNIVNGTVKSCGCLKNRQNSRRLQLYGQRFGKLIAVEPFNKLQWKCICDCGKMTIVRTVHLTNDHTKSCGCLGRQSNPIKSAKYREINARTNWSSYVRMNAPKHCEICKSIEKLEAHHIIPFKMCKQFANNLENGIVLCKTCHWDVHRKINTNETPGIALVKIMLQKTQDDELKMIAQQLLNKKYDNVFQYLATHIRGIQ